MVKVIRSAVPKVVGLFCTATVSPAPLLAFTWIEVVGAPEA
jgi:hypothetical protein